MTFSVDSRQAATRLSSAGRLGLALGLALVLQALIHTGTFYRLDIWGQCSPRSGLAFCTGRVAGSAQRSRTIAGQAVGTFHPYQPVTTSVAQQLTTEALVVPTASEIRRLLFSQDGRSDGVVTRNPAEIQAAYESCRAVTEENSKSFFLSSQLLAEDEQRAIWAIYDWCRTTDEMVDGPLAEKTTLEDLEAWAQQVEDLFNGGVAGRSGKELALVDAASKFSLIEMPFQDMIGGMAMDLMKERYETFQELEVYCWRVAGTVGVMSLPVIGLDMAMNSNDEQKELTISAAMSLGMALQLTNILRDIGEDARRNRIYVPQEDLRRFDIEESEILAASNGDGLLHHDERWRAFMEFQIARCLTYFRTAELGVARLQERNQLGVMAALFVYEGILEAVRRNDYDNFRQRAFVPLHEKVLLVGKAWWRLREVNEAVSKEQASLERLKEQSSSKVPASGAPLVTSS